MQKWQSLLAHLEVFDERGECLSEEEMLEFETTNNIKLPKDYKFFLKFLEAEGSASLLLFTAPYTLITFINFRWKLFNMKLQIVSGIP